jgi:hypothetical protein
MNSGALLRTASADTTRSYTAGKFGLTLPTGFAGWLASAQGSALNGDVVVEKMNVDNIAKKSLTNSAFDSLSLKCGNGMSRDFYNFIQASFHGDYPRVNGAIEAVDVNDKVVTETIFTNALLTEITFPTADRASKDPGSLLLKLLPETERHLPGSGVVVGSNFTASKVKPWMPRYFRLLIDGVDVSKVEKVDSFTVKQTFIAAAIGTTRDPIKQPARFTWPNVVMTIPLANDASLIAWGHQSTIDSNAATKNGSLEYLDDTMRATILKVSFSDVRFVKLSDSGLTPAPDNVTRVKIEVSVQKMTFDAPTASFD